MKIYILTNILLSVVAGGCLAMDDAAARVKLIFDRPAVALHESQNTQGGQTSPFFNPAFLPNEEGAGGNTKSHLSRVLLREEVARLSTPEDPRLYYILDTTVMSRGSFTLFTAYSKKDPGAHLLIKKVKLIASTDIESVMQEITAGLLLQSTSATSKNYNNLLNVARFYEAFVYDNNAWLVMENVTGVPLKDLPRDLITEKFVWTLSRTLLETIMLMKENSICHSDVQLESILIDNTGRIVIKDFKKAKLLSDYTSSDFKNVLGAPSSTPMSVSNDRKSLMNILSSFAAYQHAIPKESCPDLLSAGSIITKFAQALKTRSDATKGLLKYLKAIHDGLDTTVSLDTLREMNQMVFGDIGYESGIGKTDLNMKLLLGELYRDEVPFRLGTDTAAATIQSQNEKQGQARTTVTVTKTLKPTDTTMTSTATITKTTTVTQKNKIQPTSTSGSASIAANTKKPASTKSSMSGASIVQQELARAKKQRQAKLAGANNVTIEDDSGSILTSDMLQTSDFNSASVSEAREAEDPHMVALQNWLAEQFASNEGEVAQEGHMERLEGEVIAEPANANGVLLQENIEATQENQESMNSSLSSSASLPIAIPTEADAMPVESSMPTTESVSEIYETIRTTDL